MYNGNINDYKFDEKEFAKEKELAIEEIERYSFKKSLKQFGIGVIGTVLLGASMLSADLNLAQQLLGVNSGYHDMLFKIYQGMKAIGFTSIIYSELGLIKTQIDRAKGLALADGMFNVFRNQIIESEGRSR